MNPKTKMCIRDSFYYVLLGELYTGIDNNKAKQNFEAALVLAKTDSDKKAISTKINNIVWKFQFWYITFHNWLSGPLGPYFC